MLSVHMTLHCLSTRLFCLSHGVCLSVGPSSVGLFHRPSAFSFTRVPIYVIAAIPFVSTGLLHLFICLSVGLFSACLYLCLSFSLLFLSTCVFMGSFALANISGLSTGYCIYTLPSQDRTSVVCLFARLHACEPVCMLGLAPE